MEKINVNDVFPPERLAQLRELAENGCEAAWEDLLLYGAWSWNPPIIVDCIDTEQRSDILK